MQSFAKKKFFFLQNKDKLKIERVLTCSREIELRHQLPDLQIALY